MQRIVVLGGGTAGTMAANRLRHRLPSNDWDITVVDSTPLHHYQPGYLFVPFGTYEPDDLVRPRSRYLAEGVALLLGTVDGVDAAVGAVILEDGRRLPYDYLVVATGATPRPDM